MPLGTVFFFWAIPSSLLLCAIESVCAMYVYLCSCHTFFFHILFLIGNRHRFIVTLIFIANIIMCWILASIFSAHISIFFAWNSTCPIIVVNCENCIFLSTGNHCCFLRAFEIFFSLLRFVSKHDKSQSSIFSSFCLVHDGIRFACWFSAVYFKFLICRRSQIVANEIRLLKMKRKKDAHTNTHTAYRKREGDGRLTPHKQRHLHPPKRVSGHHSPTATSDTLPCTHIYKNARMSGQSQRKRLIDNLEKVIKWRNLTYYECAHSTVEISIGREREIKRRRGRSQKNQLFN